MKKKRNIIVEAANLFHNRILDMDRLCIFAMYSPKEGEKKRNY